MLSLNKIVDEAVGANQTDTGYDRQGAVNTATPRVLADPDLTKHCVQSHLTRLATNLMKSRRKANAEAGPHQSSFFGLRDTHVITDDEEQPMKFTTALTREEFDAIIVLRQNQVTADIAYLTKLREARRLTTDIWNRHPDWTWGQVEAAYALLHPIAA